MARTIDYYFSLLSPWAYIGHRPFMELADRHQFAVRYKPVALVQVFAETGGLPLAQRHPARQRYRMFELQRWREKRGLAFHLHPRFWPFDQTLADCFVIAAAEQGSPDSFLRAAFAAIWEREQNLADEGTLTEVARDAGIAASELLPRAKSEEVRQRYQRNAREAVAVDAFGSPCYVLDGEVFWGQDRLELLDDALSSRRPPYRSDA
jgi:2-hydroxychromene-2-carboxylate isomerase